MSGGVVGERIVIELRVIYIQEYVGVGAHDYVL